MSEWVGGLCSARVTESGNWEWSLLDTYRGSYIPYGASPFLSSNLSTTNNIIYLMCYPLNYEKKQKKPHTHAHTLIILA